MKYRIFAYVCLVLLLPIYAHTEIITKDVFLSNKHALFTTPTILGNICPVIITNIDPYTISVYDFTKDSFFTSNTLAFWNTIAYGNESIEAVIIPNSFAFDIQNILFSILSRDSTTNRYIEYISYMLIYCKELRPILTQEEYMHYCAYWKDKIPEPFLYILINESLKQDVPMEYLYAISYIESAKYTRFESIVENRNNTKDYGLMGLNSTNFNISTNHGKRFLAQMFYYDNEHDEFDYRNESHIVKACTKYFKTLLEITNGDFKTAAIYYNGGEAQKNAKNFKSQSIQYASIVNRIQKQHKIAYTYKGYDALTLELLKDCIAHNTSQTIPLLLTLKAYTQSYSIQENNSPIMLVYTSSYEEIQDSSIHYITNPSTLPLYHKRQKRYYGSICI